MSLVVAIGARPSGCASPAIGADVAFPDLSGPANRVPACSAACSWSAPASWSSSAAATNDVDGASAVAVGRGSLLISVLLDCVLAALPSFLALLGAPVGRLDLVDDGRRGVERRPVGHLQRHRGARLRAWLRVEVRDPHLSVRM